jgi:acyl-CoA thioester hydrolase
MSSSFSWPWRHVVPVRFCDLDAMGHVNNATYLTYLEQARNECYFALRGWTDRGDRAGLEAGLDFVVARAEVDFLRPVHYEGAVTVSIRPETVGRSSFRLAYEGHDQGGRLVLRAHTVQVCYDWAASRSKPVPPEIAAALWSGIATSGEAP